MSSERQVPSECGEAAAFDDCVTVHIDLPRPQALLLIGSASQFSDADGGVGECLMEVDDNGVFISRREIAADGPNRPSVAMNGVPRSCRPGRTTST